MTPFGQKKPPGSNVVEQALGPFPSLSLLQISLCSPPPQLRHRHGSVQSFLVPKVPTPCPLNLKTEEQKGQRIAVD